MIEKKRTTNERATKKHTSELGQRFVIGSFTQLDENSTIRLFGRLNCLSRALSSCQPFSPCREISNNSCWNYDILAHIQLSNHALPLSIIISAAIESKNKTNTNPRKHFVENNFCLFTLALYSFEVPFDCNDFR